MSEPTAIFDGHNDLAWAMRTRADYDLDRYPLDVAQTVTQTDLVRLRVGGVGAQFWSVYVPASSGERSVAATLEQIDFVLRMIARYPDDLAFAGTAVDVEAALAEGRIASLLGAEGGHSIDSSLAVLRALFALGVRYLTLTHNDNVPWADAATDVPAAGGLTAFGHTVVRELNRLGMLVDLSHTAPATMRAALATSDVPVIFSHSSARALVDHPRNVPDDVLQTLAGNGGICMVTFVPSFVCGACYAWEQDVIAGLADRGGDPRDLAQLAAAERVHERDHPRPVATIGDVADHIEHVRSVAGIEHVGLGGDFDGCDPMPAGLPDVASYPVLLDELRSRHWSPAELARLTHRNAVRVLHEAHVGVTRR